MEVIACKFTNQVIVMYDILNDKVISFPYMESGTGQSSQFQTGNNNRYIKRDKTADFQSQILEKSKIANLGIKKSNY